MTAHGKRTSGNFLFCDGHGELRKAADMRAKDFGFTAGTGATSFPTKAALDDINVPYYVMYKAAF